MHDECRISQDQKLIEMLEKCSTVRINLDGGHGGSRLVEVFHNHLEFLQILIEINNDALVHPSEE